MEEELKVFCFEKREWRGRLSYYTGQVCPTICCDVSNIGRCSNAFLTGITYCYVYNVDFWSTEIDSLPLLLALKTNELVVAIR